MKRSLALLALLGICACAPVGPNYQLPAEATVNTPAARGAFIAASAQAVAANPVPEGWWRLYDDPILNDLEREALAANTDLRVAAANLARAVATQNEVEGAREAKIGGSFAAERAQLSGEAYLLPVPLPSQYLEDGDVHLSYQLDLFGRLKRAAEAAQADSAASAAGLDLARITVAAEVARAYTEACAAGEELNTQQRTVDLQNRARTVTAKLAAAGRDSTIEVTRANASYDQARAALPALQARRQVALFRLAILTGHPPAEYPRAVEACVAPPRLRRPIPVGDGAALLKRRPDVRQAERILAAATARIGVATAALYPDVSVGLSAGSTGLLADVGQAAAQRWSVGSLISWTLPGGTEHARIAAADAATAAALAHFDGVVLNALRETESGLTVYAHDLDRNAALVRVRDSAAEASRQTQALYKAGRSPYLSGLAAQQTLAAAESTLAISDGQLAADQVNLFLALGGRLATERSNNAAVDRFGARLDMELTQCIYNMELTYRISNIGDSAFISTAPR